MKRKPLIIYKVVNIAHESGGLYRKGKSAQRRADRLRKKHEGEEWFVVKVEVK